MSNNLSRPESHELKGVDAIQKAANSILAVVTARVKNIKAQGTQVILKIEGERQKTRMRFKTSATINVGRNYTIPFRDVVAAVRSGLSKECIQLPRVTG